MLRIIQVSDAHLFADVSKELLGVNTQDSFSAVRDKIRRDEANAKVILLTGDLSQDNSEASYLRLSEMLKPLQIPVYYVPGNHDQPALMESTFPRDIISEKKHVVLEGWQIILLNSQKTGAIEGFLAETELDFMKRCLEEYPHHHAIIVFHHHPVCIDSKWLDNIWLTNAGEFWEIAPHYPNVKTVLFGHVHQEFSAHVGNIGCYSTPSTCFQFMRKQDGFSLENLPPGYRWLDLYEDGRFKSGVERVSNYVGKFDENAKGY